MRSHVGVASLMFQTLSNEGINIQMISTSEIKTSVHHRRQVHGTGRALAAQGVRAGPGAGRKGIRLSPLPPASRLGIGMDSGPREQAAASVEARRSSGAVAAG